MIEYIYPTDYVALTLPAYNEVYSILGIPIVVSCPNLFQNYSQNCV